MTLLEREAGRKGQRFDSPEQEAFLNLWRTYDLLKAVEDELFSRFGSRAAVQRPSAAAGIHPERVPTLALAGRLVSRAPDITRLLAGLMSADLWTASGGRVTAGRSTWPSPELGRVLLDDLDAECAGATSGSWATYHRLSWRRSRPAEEGASSARSGRKQLEIVHGR